MRSPSGSEEGGPAGRPLQACLPVCAVRTAQALRQHSPLAPAPLGTGPAARWDAGPRGAPRIAPFAGNDSRRGLWAALQTGPCAGACRAAERSKTRDRAAVTAGKGGRRSCPHRRGAGWMRASPRAAAPAGQPRSAPQGTLRCEAAPCVKPKVGFYHVPVLPVLLQDGSSSSKRTPKKADHTCHTKSCTRLSQKQHPSRSPNAQAAQRPSRDTRVNEGGLRTRGDRTRP